MFYFQTGRGIIFGWSGDNIGRKATAIITTAIMAITITATLAPYSEIGIAATIVITLCRVAQGI
ncbi:hypothetical protein [Rickettsia honei]|uniref:hypothetical protein n=1 Tax=Rickettsia honei TaxID=37816 RepID=UPI00031DA378|nr:hypothetical protein [Rickettsia honei]